MVGYVCHRVTPRDTFTSLGLIRDSFGKEVDSNVNGTVRVIQHPLCSVETDTSGGLDRLHRQSLPGRRTSQVK